VKIRKKNGFSLIELLIVTVLIGIMATMGSFSWQRYTNNANLRTAARDLASDMANAKQRAVAEGVHYYMTISTSDNNYTIERRNTLNTASTVLATKSIAAFGAGLTISSNNYPLGFIDFEPRGTTSLGNVVLQNSRGAKATINSNVTGKTYVTFAMQ
jgi:type II secretion system protein H